MSGNNQMNTNLISIGKKTKKAVDCIYIADIFLFIACYACKLTITYLSAVNYIYVGCTVVMAIIALYRVFFAYFEDRKKAVLPLLAIVFGAVVNLMTGNNLVLLSAAASVAGLGVSADKILTAGICGNLVMIGNNIYTSLMNRNGVFVVDYQERQFLFLGNNSFSVSKMNNLSSTDFAAHYFWIIAPYLWVRGKKITWGEIFGLAGLNVFIYTMTASKSALLCIFMLLLCTFVMKIWPLISKPNGEAAEGKANIFVKIIDICVKYSYVVLAAVCILFSALFTASNPFLMTLNHMLNNRLSLAKRGIVEHGIHLFSSGIENYGVASSADGFYNFIDCSYINLMFFGGVLVLVFYLLSMTAIQIKHKRYIYGAAILAVCALSCVDEHHLCELPYNMFMLILFADFNVDKKVNPVAEKKKNISNVLNLCSFGLCALFLGMSVMNYYPKYKAVKELDRLDARAGDIYNAVQTNIDGLVADGTWTDMTSSMDSYDYGQKLSKPEFFADVTGVSWYEANQDSTVHADYSVLYDAQGSASSALIVDLMMSDDVKALIGNGSVVIEYDVISGKLYSVWYSETPGCYVIEDGRSADRAGRLRSDVLNVEGYYTGNDNG